MKAFLPVRVRQYLVLLAVLLGILVGLVVPVRSQSLDQLHNQGVALYNQGQYAEAAGVFLQALEINPRALPPLRYLGGSLVQLERYEDAVDILGRSLELNPYDVDSLYDLGVAYDHLGQLELAAENYQKAAQEYEIRPESLERLKPEDIFNNLGITQLAQNQSGEALESFRKTTALDTTYGQGFYLQGIVHTQQQDYPQARQSFDSSVDPEVRFEFRERGYNGRGVAEYLDGDLTESLQSLGESIQTAQSQQRTYPTAFSNRGLTHFDLGDLQDAESDYTQVTTLVADRPDGFRDLGYVRYEMGEKARLIARAADPLKLIAALPSATAQYFQTQVAYYAEHHPQQQPLLLAALPFVTDSPWLPALPTELQPTSLERDPVGMTRIALSELALTKLEEAISAYRRAIELDRNDAQAHYGIASARRSQGRFQDALAEFETAGTLYASVGDTLWESFTRQLDIPAVAARIASPEPPANSVNLSSAAAATPPAASSYTPPVPVEQLQPTTPAPAIVRDGFNFTQAEVVSLYDADQNAKLLEEQALSMSKDASVRREAVQALRLKRYRPAYPALQAQLVQNNGSYLEPDPGVRSSILYFLEEVEAPPPPAPVAAIPIAAAAVAPRPALPQPQPPRPAAPTAVPPVQVATPQPTLPPTSQPPAVPTATPPVQVATPRPTPPSTLAPAPKAESDPKAEPISFQLVNTSFAPPPTAAASASGCGGSSLVSAAICRIRG
ncbi:MAG: tetratricopeptide repeat protein [Synechococcaceae cyanobacterium SM2_3_2]|nr:tetratricopeptide repeat protein [Synechococcaceae cyanobacterium SM2_3_2]